MGTRIASNLHFSPQKSTFATSSQAGNFASGPLSIPLRLRHLDCSTVPLSHSVTAPLRQGSNWLSVRTEGYIKY